jgi:hypothetical protein
MGQCARAPHVLGGMPWADLAIQPPGPWRWPWAQPALALSEYWSPSRSPVRLSSMPAVAAPPRRPGCPRTRRAGPPPARPPHCTKKRSVVSCKVAAEGRPVPADLGGSSVVVAGWTARAPSGTNRVSGTVTVWDGLERLRTTKHSEYRPGAATATATSTVCRERSASISAPSSTPAPPLSP